MKIWRGGVWRFSIVLLLVLSSETAVSAQPAIFYVYDNLNRLVGVIDQQGNAATYTYDLTGNLLKIDRFNIAELPVAITLVSPNKGRVGASVQIFGKGFSATGSQNTVTFNGVAATVAEAASNRLLVTVPTGATTGLISVTTPSGSANSPSAFTVLGGMAISPTTATLTMGTTRQFAAFEDGTPTTNVTWAVNGVTGGDAAVGTISTDGFYTAPLARLGALVGMSRVTVTATHQDDRLASANATVTVIAPSAVTKSISVAIASPTTVDKNVQTRLSAAFSQAMVVDKSVGNAVSVQLAPAIAAVSPSTGTHGTTVTVTITGSGFTGATALTVLVNNASDANITVANLSVTSDTSATADLTMSSTAALGTRVIQMTTPGGSSTAAGTDGTLFTVQ